MGYLGKDMKYNRDILLTETYILRLLLQATFSLGLSGMGSSPCWLYTENFGTKPWRGTRPAPPAIKRKKKFGEEEEGTQKDRQTDDENGRLVNYYQQQLYFRAEEAAVHTSQGAEGETQIPSPQTAPFGCLI